MPGLPESAKPVESVLQFLMKLGHVEGFAWFPRNDEFVLSVRWTQSGKTAIAGYVALFAELCEHTEFGAETMDALNELLTWEALKAVDGGGGPEQELE